MNKCLLLFFVVILMLVSCSPMLQQEGPIETVGAITSVTDSTNTIVPTKTETPAPPTPTARETDVPTSTETPALSTMEILMRAVLNAPAGSEEYMAADKAFVEYMNASTPEEVTVNLNVGGNSYEIAWIHDWRGDGLGSWRWVGEAEATGHGEAIDRALESIPGPFIEGGIDENGNAYAIHPETGERIIASKINMPGWGEMTIVELLQMDPEELKGHITELMGRAGATDKLIAGTKERRFALPVMILNNFHQQNGSNFVYHTIIRGLGGGGIPEESDPLSIHRYETNTLLVPLYDNGSGQILGWVAISQGVRMNPAVLTFNSGGGVDFKIIRGGNLTGTLGDGSERAGIILSGSTMEDEFNGLSDTPLLELGGNVGSQAEILELTNLMRVGKIQEALELAKEKGLYVLFPTVQVYQK